jgi:hypothetical protein
MDETNTATTAADATTTEPGEDAAPPASEPVTTVTEAPAGLPSGASTDAQAQAEDKPNEHMAQLENDSSVMMLGIIPLGVILLVFVTGAVMYVIRRRKNWSELGDALRIDDGDKPLGKSAVEHFSTRELEGMEATRPSQRITDIKSIKE